MQSKQDLVDRLRPVVEAHPVHFALLYGSFSEGHVTPISDVDVAVYVEDREVFLRLVVALDEAVPERKVDVINLVRQPAMVYYRVLTTGTVIHMADEALYDEEKCRVMREYLDFKPVHDRILQDMDRRLEDGRYGDVIE